ncbi:hypothetical protein VPH35_021056 [Triticum aestivum]
MPLSQLAKKHLFEPDTSELANPVITKLGVPHGHPELGPRGWTAGPSFSARCYQPPAPGPRLDEASTLGTHMISKGLGWENHEVEYAPMPLGYLEWGTNVLKKYHTHLKGSEEGVDYVYGAIYCSLGDYSVSPSLLRSLLERWDPNTNMFLFSSGKRTVTLLDMHQIAGLPLDGEPYEEYVPLADELDPSTLLYPNFLPRLLKIWTKLAVGGKSLEKAETPITDQWRLVLYNYLNDVVAAQPVKSKELRRGNVLKQNALAGSSSAHPLSADNDISDTAPSASGKRHRQSTAPHLEQEERLPSKRKLDFGQESNFLEPITLDGCEQEIRHSQDPKVMVVSGKDAEMDCSFVKDTFMEATDFVVKRALEGLNDSTLGDPKRRIMLESVSQTLPTQVPEVAKVQAMLVGLIDLSKKLEVGQTKFTEESERDEHVVAEVGLKIKSGHEVSKAIIEDLSAVEKKCTEMEAREAELKAQFEEVTATLHRLKLEMEQRRQAHDAHKSEQEKLVKSVQDTNAGKHARLAEFKQKTADLKTEASQLLNSLQNWRAL